MLPSGAAPLLRKWWSNPIYCLLKVHAYTVTTIETVDPEPNISFFFHIPKYYSGMDSRQATMELENGTRCNEYNE